MSTTTITNRPLSALPSTELVKLIHALDADAILEGAFRTSAKVLSALGNVDAGTIPPAKGLGSRGANPQKFGRGLYAQRVSGEGYGSAAFWDAYRSDEAKELYSKVRTFQGARQVTTRFFNSLATV